MVKFVALYLLVIAMIAFHPALAGAEMGQAAGSIDGVTTITLQNWQNYREFMSDGLIALFEGKEFWHLPRDLRIEVGRTTSIPLPKKRVGAEDGDQNPRRWTR